MNVSLFLLTSFALSFTHMRSNEHVDPYRTMTNDVYECCQVLGIEAVRLGAELEIKNGKFLPPFFVANWVNLHIGLYIQ